MAYNPERNPVDWVLLEGRRSPGIAVVEGAGSPRGWDQAQGYGLSGAFVRYTGDKLSQFKIFIRLGFGAFGRTADQEWEDWEAWRPLVLKGPRTLPRPKAKDIWHPFLEALGIKAVVIEDCSQPKQVEHGVWEIVVDCLQYRAPKPQYAKPDGAKATTTDPVDKRIEELTKQVQELAA